MRIDSRKLTGLPVVTETGQALGKVLAFDVDVEAHAVMGYHVGPSWPRGEKYLVSPAQVVSITAERMTVTDTTVRANETSAVRVRGGLPSVNPIASRQE
jgi:sporulation protein YlmC with PRC-barrel domain